MWKECKEKCQRNILAGIGNDLQSILNRNFHEIDDEMERCVFSMDFCNICDHRQLCIPFAFQACWSKACWSKACRKWILFSHSKHVSNDVWIKTKKKNWYKKNANTNIRSQLILRKWNLWFSCRFSVSHVIKQLCNEWLHTNNT